jgi:hypothetical protein
VGIDNRLTADQLASLTAGDSVTIESGADFGRKRYRSGRVVRIDPFDIMVNAPGPKGGSFIERYSRRDGVRVGGVGRAELVTADSSEPALTEARRRTRDIDVLYREWTRNRTDADSLLRLYAAIGQHLQDAGSDAAVTR